jgi:hypothetical protein
MILRNVAFLLVGLVIGVVATLTLRPEPSHAQEKGDVKVTAGRYQMSAAPIQGGGSLVFVLDTATGCIGSA